MNLLLFLSALLTGLTGAISVGQRADAPAVQHSIVRAAEIAAENVVQRPSLARERAAAARRAIVSIAESMPVWALTVDTRAFDIRRICEKMLA